MRDLIQTGLVKSAHDCSEGGLAVALAESCFSPERLFGAEIIVAQASGLREDESSVVALRGEEDRKRDACATLFNEAQSRIVISVAPADSKRVISALSQSGVPFEQLGRVGGDQLQIQVNGKKISWRISDLYDDWFNAIRRAVGEEESIPSL